MPDPGHSISGLFEPVKSKTLKRDKIALLGDQIRGLKPANLRVAFGFLLDLLFQGDEPALTNAPDYCLLRGRKHRRRFERPPASATTVFVSTPRPTLALTRLHQLAFSIS